MHNETHMKLDGLPMILPICGPTHVKYVAPCASGRATERSSPYDPNDGSSSESVWGTGTSMPVSVFTSSAIARTMKNPEGPVLNCTERKSGLLSYWKAARVRGSLI